MAIAKGWDLKEIEILGTNEFIECIENEIYKRKNQDDSTVVDIILSDEDLEPDENETNKKSVRSSLNL